MKNITIFFALAFLMALVSCSSGPAGRIDSLEKKVNRLDTLQSPSERDWDELIREADALEHDLDSNRTAYTSEEIERANKLIGRSSVLKMKRGLQEFEQQLKDAGQRLEGALEGLLADTTNQQP
jgi:phosphoserine phosphatase